MGGGTAMMSQQAAATRQAPEALTIAYLALGAGAVWEERQRARQPRPDGQLEFIEEVVEHALLVDRVADEFDDLIGCFCYEIAEPLGRWIAERLCAGASVEPAVVAAEARALLVEAAR